MTRRLRVRGLRVRRPVGLGLLRRTRPISDHWGSDRGRPVDRYYIESFLRDYRSDIQGRVLEIKDSRYTTMFGNRVERAEILDLDPTNTAATVVGDLASAPHIPSESFDCVILTQTLQFVYPVQEAIATVHRVLRPGGVLLATVPSVSRIDRHAGIEADYWRFAPAGCTRLFGDVFGNGQVSVRAYGNVLAAIAFLHGLSCEDVGEKKLDIVDPLFPVLVGVRAERA